MTPIANKKTSQFQQIQIQLARPNLIVSLHAKPLANDAIHHTSSNLHFDTDPSNTEYDRSSLESTFNLPIELCA